jgi:oligoribonuclease
VDLEMTGLDPEQDRIVEVAAIVTDMNFEAIAQFEAVIKQPQKILDRMKDGKWYDYSSGKRTVVGTVYDIASQNGLIERIANGQSEKQVEQDLSAFITEYCGSDRVYLAGNSIHQDRRFIRRWWPTVEALLHYRMVDVTTLKVLAHGLYDAPFKRQDSHRALEDIQGSILELQYYLRLLKRRSPSPPDISRI